MMKIGLSSCSKPFDEGLFLQYREAKLDCMEISYSKAETDKFDFAAANTYAQKYGVELWSLHLPFMPFVVLDLSNPLLSNYTVEYYKKVISSALQFTGIKRFVVHPSGEPIAGIDRKRRMETAQKALLQLADFVKPYDAYICVEDLPRTCLGRDSSEILSLIQDRDELRVCFDTNHLLKEPIDNFIKAVNTKIETVHVSDYDFEDEKHWLPGEGDINWNELYGTLQNVGYRGPWLYEVGFDTPRSKQDRSRRLNCRDFYNNATQIFNGENITRI